MAPTSKVAPPTPKKPPLGAPATATKLGDPKKVAFRIERVSRSTKWLNLLIYGNYGVGKTYLAATAADVPEMQHVLLINAESGEMSIDNAYADQVYMVSVQNFRTTSRVYEWLKQHCANQIFQY